MLYDFDLFPPAPEPPVKFTTLNISVLHLRLIQIPSFPPNNNLYVFVLQSGHSTMPIGPGIITYPD